MTDDADLASLTRLADFVRTLPREGHGKIEIATVRRAVAERAPRLARGLDDMLIEGNRIGLLALTRCDLPSMLVHGPEASEVAHVLGGRVVATYHLID